MQCITFIAAAMMVGSAAAQVSTPDDRRGAIVGAHFVYAINDYDFNASGLSADDALGFEILGGYRFNPYVDLTGVFQYLSDFDVNGPVAFVNGFPIAGTVASAWGFSFMPISRVYPFADLLPPWVEPFGLAGMGAIFADANGTFSSGSDATFAFRFGAGVDFHIIPELVVELGGSYVVAVSDLNILGVSVAPNYAPIVAGIEYRF